jgi:amidophosphoribosyltransferase
VVVDDSIVRGNTARSRVRLLRKAGAREVHLRISCPPIKFPCFFGIDFPTPEELIANTHDHAGMVRELEADSLGYLSLEGTLRCASRPADNYCTACFSGRYPIDPPRSGDKLKHERGGC